MYASWFSTKLVILHHLSGGAWCQSAQMIRTVVVRYELLLQHKCVLGRFRGPNQAQLHLLPTPLFLVVVWWDAYSACARRCLASVGCVCALFTTFAVVFRLLLVVWLQILWCCPLQWVQSCRPFATVARQLSRASAAFGCAERHSRAVVGCLYCFVLVVVVVCMPGCCNLHGITGSISTVWRQLVRLGGGTCTLVESLHLHAHTRLCIQLYL